MGRHRQGGGALERHGFDSVRRPAGSSAHPGASLDPRSRRKHLGRHSGGDIAIQCRGRLARRQRTRTRAPEPRCSKTAKEISGQAVREGLSVCAIARLLRIRRRTVCRLIAMVPSTWTASNVSRHGSLPWKVADGRVRRVGSVGNAGLGHDAIYSITGDGLRYRDAPGREPSRGSPARARKAVARR